MPFLQSVFALFCAFFASTSQAAYFDYKQSDHLDYKKIADVPVIKGVDLLRASDIPDHISLERDPLHAVMTSGSVPYSELKGSAFHFCYTETVSKIAEDQRRRDNNEYRRITKGDGSTCVTRIASLNETTIRTSKPFYLPYKDSSAKTITIGGRVRHAISASSDIKGRISDFFDLRSKSPLLLGEGESRGLNVSIVGRHFNPTPIPANTNIQRELSGLIIQNPESLGIRSWEEIGSRYFMALKARVKSYNTFYSSDFQSADSEIFLDATEVAVVNMETGKPVASVPFSNQNLVYAWRLLDSRVSNGETIAIEVAGRIIPAQQHGHTPSSFYESIKTSGLLDEYGSMDVEAFKEILASTANSAIQK